MTTSDWKIAVVGAGIGGLTLALALRQHGIEVELYEQTPELREVGAAVALFRFKRNVIHVIGACAALGLLFKTVLP